MTIDIAQLPLPRWEVDLIGDEWDLEHLAKYFNSDPQFVYRDEQLKQTFMLMGAHAPDADVEDVLSDAESVAKELSGVLKATRNSSRQIKIGGAMQRQINGTRHVYSYVSLSAHARVELTGEVLMRNSDGKPMKVAEAPPESVRLARIIKTDGNAAKIVRFSVAMDANQWTGLARTLEAIQHDLHPKGLSVEKLGWSSANEVKRFERTANSSASGDGSRHGYERYAPPSNPMNLDEARNYMQKLLRSWTTYRLSLFDDGVGDGKSDG